MTTPHNRVREGAPSPEALAIREALKTAVENELEKKRKLGHYYAWVTAEGVELIGPNAPVNTENRD